jgi:hypothetical protein
MPRTTMSVRAKHNSRSTTTPTQHRQLAAIPSVTDATPLHTLSLAPKSRARPATTSASSSSSSNITIAPIPSTQAPVPGQSTRRSRTKNTKKQDNAVASTVDSGNQTRSLPPPAAESTRTSAHALAIDVQAVSKHVDAKLDVREDTFLHSECFSVSTARVVEFFPTLFCYHPFHTFLCANRFFGLRKTPYSSTFSKK